MMAAREREGGGKEGGAGGHRGRGKVSQDERSGPIARWRREACWWAPWQGATIAVVHALKAQVRGGRLVLDEPTDLPEGSVIDLVPLEDALADMDDLDGEERARLHGSIDRGIADARAGRVVDARSLIAGLRARFTER